MQTTDALGDPRDRMQIVTKRAPSDEEWVDLLFAWTVCARVKSNSVVLANNKHQLFTTAGVFFRF